jgi:3-methyladenine DNA glycosylase AlkC
MSRSIRKTKIFGVATAISEKQDKRLWNRKFRKVCKRLINVEKEPPVNINSVTNIWSGAKDGRRYVISATKKDMRK